MIKMFRGRLEEPRCIFCQNYISDDISLMEDTKIYDGGNPKNIPIDVKKYALVFFASANKKYIGKYFHPQCLYDSEYDSFKVHGEIFYLKNDLKDINSIDPNKFFDYFLYPDRALTDFSFSFTSDIVQIDKPIEEKDIKTLSLLAFNYRLGFDMRVKPKKEKINGYKIIRAYKFSKQTNIQLIKNYLLSHIKKSFIVYNETSSFLDIYVPKEDFNDEVVEYITK